MITDFVSTKALLLKVSELHMYDTLLLQIQKDFNRANVEIKLRASISIAQLEQRIQEKLYLLLLERFEEYLNLLYVIDIPEKSLKEIKSEDIVEISKQVGFLLLKREFQKIWYKNKYS